MSAQIESFSGTHPFKTDCAIVAIELDWIDQGIFSEAEVHRLAGVHAARVAERIEAGECPRCKGPIDSDRLPAGSRTTLCRCIPVCSACGEDEAFQPMLGRPMSRIWQWPISKGHRTRRRNKVMAKATLTTAIVTGDNLITEDGSSELKLRPHPGGWAEYGYDEEVEV